MKIKHVTVNHIKNPIGFHMDEVTLQWIITESSGNSIRWTQIQIALDRNMEHIIYDTGKSTGVDSGGTKLDMRLSYQTRYYGQITICDNFNNTDKSELFFFETAKDEKQWAGEWVTPVDQEDTIVGKSFSITKKVRSARLYVTGLGLYEAYFDGKKVGNEYLTPGFCDYDSWIQFQTYEIEPFECGEHVLEVLLGEGFYKGRFLHMGPGEDRNRYGTELAALAELHLIFEDGTKEIIGTNEQWYSRKSEIIESGIYDGEKIDPQKESMQRNEVRAAEFGYERLVARYGLPVVVKEVRKPERLLHTPNGELVLDFGQNMVGWIRFLNRLKAGEICICETGEILQNNNFYRENYRTAKSEFRYHSDGEERWVRPHFTYYGFRYVKLQGFQEPIQLEDFQAMVLYSDMEQTGEITTGSAKVNQLISNILWGQKGNFVDVPTDCPQRDECMGWTGDAQVFSMTAAYNMDTYTFYRKFMKDLRYEQTKNLGAVPFTVPDIAFGGKTSSAWGDAATIIPWNMYLMYGDVSLLETQYSGMKDWVDYIKSRDALTGNQRLWIADNHFGDWLALDSSKAGIPTGGTDMTLIATGYYYLSSVLTAKAADVLDKMEDCAKYTKLAKEIKAAFLREYMTENGHLAVDTQTAYAFVLYLGLFRENQSQKLVDGLEEKIRKNQNHLDTGFVGTPILCQMLSQYGKNELAYELLLNEEYPGWLYAVNLGATTVWERWNSVLPDGSMNPDGMNSLNHYAYGAIGQWMYQYMLGIKPDEKKPGWKHFFLCPMPDKRLGFAEGKYKSCYGTIESGWRYEKDGNLHFHFTIPFQTTATVRLYDVNVPEMELEAGSYDFIYPSISASKKGYNRNSTLSVLLQDEESRAILERFAPDILASPPQFAQGTLQDFICNIFGTHNKLELQSIENELKLL